MSRYSLFIRVFFIGLLVTGGAVASPFSGNNEGTSIAQLPAENIATPSADLHNNWLFDHVDKTADRIKSVPIPAAILLFGPATLCLLGLSGKRK
ncbi:MAG: hypothetical protein K9L25_09810 [Methylovulum sp.]|nr:hypothetical protein [Methylovulum sp.]